MSRTCLAFLLLTFFKSSSAFVENVPNRDSRLLTDLVHLVELYSQ